MIRAIVQFCIQERLIVVLVALLVVVLGWFSANSVPLDAIPNVGDNQVIVLADWPGQSPKDVEDQLTYPLSVALQAVPGAISVRGKSMFGFSFVQVTFADIPTFIGHVPGSRSNCFRCLREKSPKGSHRCWARMPPGWVRFSIMCLNPTPETDLAELRSLQDYVVKLALESVDGVAEVASDWRLRSAVSDRSRSGQAALPQHHLEPTVNGRAGVQCRSGGQDGRDVRHGISGPRQGLSGIRKVGSGND